MTIILTELRYERHAHASGEEYDHYDCTFRANGRPATITVVVQARLAASAWFSLSDFLKDACCERVRAWYSEPALVEWG